MAQEFEVVSANLLPAATNITDNDMLLIIQSGRPKRALPSAMKGKQGDPGPSPYLGVTNTHIQWKQGVSGTWQNLIALDKLRGEKGEKPLFRKHEGFLQMKYEGEPDTAYRNLFDREELKLNFSDLTPAEIAQLKLRFSDLTEAEKVELMSPAVEAATEVRQTMSAIQSEAETAIQSVVSVTEDARSATEDARVAAKNVQDGKTPVIAIGTVENGSTAAATITPAGTDESGNPKSALNLVLPKGKDGEPPVVNYSVLTGEPGTEVQVSQEEAGFTPKGNPIYQVTLTIPRGDTGRPGLGSGNVYVDGTGLLAGEKYLFVPSATDSTEGTFVKYEDAPADGKSYGRKDGKWQEVAVDNALDVTPIMIAVASGRAITQDVMDSVIAAHNNKCVTFYSVNDGVMDYLVGAVKKDSDGNYSICSTDSRVIKGQSETEKISEIGTVTININATTLIATFDAIVTPLKSGGDGSYFLSADGEYHNVFQLPEAPKDGKTYGRKDGAWSETTLPVASSTVLGGVKTGDNLTNDAGTLSLAKDNVTNALGYTPVAPEAGKGLFSGKYDDLANKPNTISNPINIAVNSDLNSIITPGFYFCPKNTTVETLINSPTTVAFGMIVQQHAGIQQHLVEFKQANPEIFFRNYYSGDKTWGPWYREYTSANPPALATVTSNGFMSTQDKVKLDRVHSYTNSSGLSRLGYDWENIYVNLSANDSLSLVDSAFNTSNNGRSITIYVYCSASCTITIPTTGNYVSMCGSSYTCPAGKWVEFSLTCVEGKWHIAKLEQE